MNKPAAALLLLLLGPVGSLVPQDREAVPVLSVLDFATTGISVAEARVFVEVLSTRIVRTAAYRLIDRQQRQTMLEEIEFSSADCTDEGCQLEIGRLLEASQIVVGTIARAGSRVAVRVRRLEVATGQTLGGADRDYPSLEAMVDGAGELAEQVLGAEARRLPSGRTPNARALISAARQDEMETRLQGLIRRVDQGDYRHWLSARGFAEYERGAAVHEKVDFLEEYLRQSNSRGHAVDMAVSFTPYRVREAPESDGTYRDLNGRVLGVTVSWSYQFDNRIAGGANLCLAQQRHLSRTYDAAAVLISEETESEPFVFLGPLLILGDKAGGLALLLSTGLTVTVGLGPYLSMRTGLYYRNFYVGYLGQLALRGEYGLHGVEAGYSLFLGRRRSWP